WPFRSFGLGGRAGHRPDRGDVCPGRRGGAAIVKVLMTVDAVGGVWTYAVTLCRALVPHGVEVVFACMGPPPAPQQGAAVLDLPNVRIYVSDCRLEWMPC